MEKFSLHWFDLIVVVVLIVGILRGRKNGMSIEFMLLLQWLAIVAVASFGYKLFGGFISQTAGISRLWGYIISYATCVVVVRSIFALIHRATGGKLVSADTFGSGEYYLGMAAGAVRFFCMTLVFLAILNARLYTPQELEAQEKYQAKWFEGIRLPTIGTTQFAVFKKSLTGRMLHDFAGFLLIEASAPEQKQFKQKEFDAR